MIFGPLSEFDISILTEKLDKVKVDYKVSVSDEHVAANEQEHLDRDGSLPVKGYRPTQPYLMIEIADSLIHYVEADLEKMGALPPTESSGELEHEEFLCPKCDYISQAPGTCPKHGVALVDYSSWVAGVGKSSSDKSVAFVFVAIIAAAVYFLFFR